MDDQEFIHLGRSQEGERREFLPVCDNPMLFLKFLRETNEYKKIVDDRLRLTLERFRKLFQGAGKIDSEIPAREEVIKVFENDEEFKQLVWDYNQDVVHLRYNPVKLPPSFNSAFSEYKVKARESLVEISKGTDPDAMREKDSVRSVFHNKAAQSLVEEGIAETEYIGRILVRCFLVDKGEDFIPSARMADQLRVIRSLPDRESLVRFLSNSVVDSRVSRFSPMRAAELQDEIKEVYPDLCQGQEVKRDIFLERPRIDDVSGKRGGD